MPTCTPFHHHLKSRLTVRCTISQIARRFLLACVVQVVGQASSEAERPLRITNNKMKNWLKELLSQYAVDSYNHLQLYTIVYSGILRSKSESHQQKLFSTLLIIFFLHMLVQARVIEFQNSRTSTKTRSRESRAIDYSF